MTRRIAVASVTVVCVVMLVLGAVLYVRISNDLHVTTRLARGRPFLLALDRLETHLTLTKVRRELVIGALLGALLAAAALVWVTRRALAPVRSAADVADQIARTTDLRARVPVAPGTDELARLTSSINRMLERLEVSDGALRRLVGDASHELRTPITSLRGNIELLRSTAPVTEADRMAALDDAFDETRRLERLVEDLLALARADAAPAPEPVPVAALVEGLPPARVTIMPAAAGATVSGDRPSLQAVVRNLTDNAERYGGGDWSLTVDAHAGSLIARVADHGPGIPPQERERVFERFARGTTAGETAGSGIGLAIVDAVVHAHRGTVAIEDTPGGGGATFVVTLPTVVN
jgi:signal transduction histidine kinase